MAFELLDQSYLQSRRADLTEQGLLDEYALMRRAYAKTGRLPEATLLTMVANQLVRKDAAENAAKPAEAPEPTTEKAEKEKPSRKLAKAS